MEELKIIPFKYVPLELQLPLLPIGGILHHEIVILFPPPPPSSVAATMVSSEQTLP